MLITVVENMRPMGYWTVISNDPFRVLISTGVGKHSLGLLKMYKEAAVKSPEHTQITRNPKKS